MSYFKQHLPVIGLCGLCIFLATVTTLRATDWDALSDSLVDLRCDYAKQFQVRDYTIERGGVRFVLQDGTISLSSPVMGRPFGAVFSGRARFQLTPPNKAESYMFARHCGSASADWEISELVLLFADSTDAEIARAGEPLADGKRKNEDRLLSEFIKYIEKEFEQTFAALILTDILQPHRAGHFRASFKAPCGRMFFVFDPAQVEEVQLYKHAHTADDRYPDLISSFHSPDQYTESVWGPDREEKDEIDSLSYFIDCKIWQSTAVDVAVDLSFNALVDGLRVAKFDLYHDIIRETISVTDAAGDTLFWQKLKDESAITVYLNEPLSAGERQTLRFTYSSKGLLKMTPWGNNVLRTATYWYPRYGYLKRSSYRLRFSCPKQYVMLSVGKKTSDIIEDGLRVTEWDAADYPIAVVSYNYGTFNSASTTTSEGFPVSVYAGTALRGSTKSILDKVLGDVAASLELFSKELYTYPFEEMTVTEILPAHGQGFPGLLHLAWGTFQYEEIGVYDAFRAHEVAHQWWGHIVGWKTYHDQWLSEAFAEYSGAWYVQRKYLEDDRYRGKFYELMDRWRDDVFQSGGFTKSGAMTSYAEGNSAGPIWMGHRLASSKSADYFTLVYSKGAYVLYMLRMMMFDFATRDDSRFLAMLTDFLERYRWSEATTRDFIEVAEKHYGEKLDWFFDQWVYDVQLPEYEWSTTATQNFEGKYVVTLRVRTKGVSEDFQMPIPITVMMEGDYHTTTRVMISGHDSVVNLPELPYKPVKFIFNTFKSVLCKSKEK